MADEPSSAFAASRSSVRVRKDEQVVFIVDGNTKKNQKLTTFRGTRSLAPTSATLSLDGAGISHAVASNTAGSELVLAAAERGISFISTDEMKIMQQLKVTLKGKDQTTSCVAWASKNKHIAFGTDAGHVMKVIRGSNDSYALDVVKGRKDDVAPQHSMGVRCVAFSPDAQLLVSASMDKTAIVYQTILAG